MILYYEIRLFRKIIIFKIVGREMLISMFSSQARKSTIAALLKMISLHTMNKISDWKPKLKWFIFFFSFFQPEMEMQLQELEQHSSQQQ